MFRFSNNIILSSYKEIFRLLPRSFRIKGLWVSISLMIGSILELLGLATLIPLFTIILEEDAFQKHPFLADLLAFSGFEEENTLIIALSIGIFLFVLAKNLLDLGIKYIQAQYSFGLFRYFTTNLMAYFYQKGYTFLQEKNSNEIVRDIAEAPNRFAKNLVMSLLSYMNELMILILIGGGIFMYDPKVVFLVLAVVGPTYFIFYMLVRKRIARLNEYRHELKAVLNKNLYESIFGYIDVEVNNRSTWFFDKYFQNVSKLKKLLTELHVFLQAPNKVVETAMILGVLCIVIYGVAFLEDKSQLTILLGVFAIGAFRIVPSINRMLTALLNIKGNLYTLDIIKQIKDLKESEEALLTEKIPFEDKISVKNLSFRYNENQPIVLDQLSFEIQKGQSVGIIGKSGSGKTTLVNIMLRFLKETEGQIFIDNLPLSEQNTAQWRNLVGYVPQEVFIADGTLAENIAFGQGEVDEERLLEVIHYARLDEVLKDLPKGIHTPIGERGSQLSGGQRQRVGIARALYAGVEILFFDEATSALDQETENEITEAIQRLSEQGLTLIVIAHRITTLKYCDKILELEAGKLSHTYQYSELLAKSL